MQEWIDEDGNTRSYIKSKIEQLKAFMKHGELTIEEAVAYSDLVELDEKLRMIENDLNINRQPVTVKPITKK